MDVKYSGTLSQATKIYADLHPHPANTQRVRTPPKLKKKFETQSMHSVLSSVRPYQNSLLPPVMVSSAMGL